jgi:hypothetical protein
MPGDVRILGLPPADVRAFSPVKAPIGASAVAVGDVPRHEVGQAARDVAASDFQGRRHLLARFTER